MKKMRSLCSLRDWLYRVHVVTGLVAALWLLLTAVTGVMINHQESLGLLDVEISDRFLPDSYRADVRTGSTRLNIIVTDLHSGRIFGAYGHWIGDWVALFLFVSLFSGAFSYVIKRRLQHLNHHRKPVRGTLHPTNGKQQWQVPRMAGETPEDRYHDASQSSHIRTL